MRKKPKIIGATLKDVPETTTPMTAENLRKVGFDKDKDTRSVCHSLACVCYGPMADPNVRVKVSKKTFQDWLEVASFVALANFSIYYHELYKRALEENIPSDEILGEFQLELQECWNQLAKHKLGRDCFKEMSVEDILNTPTPYELLRKAAKNIL
jgi:hypothetical protein